MQRSFSTFPAGWPGVGLLLLRATVGTAALAQAAFSLLASGNFTLGTRVFGVSAGALGVALLLGFFTPFAGALAALSCVAIALAWLPTPITQVFSPRLSFILLAIMATAIVFLGPGAFSLDCRLFGRREIIIPRSPKV